jgi:hypothetical protein
VVLWIGALASLEKSRIGWLDATAALAIALPLLWSAHWEGVAAGAVVTGAAVVIPRQTARAVSGLYIGLMLVAVSVLFNVLSDRPSGIFQNSLAASHVLSLAAVAVGLPWLLLFAGLTGSITPFGTLAMSAHMFRPWPGRFIMAAVSLAIGALIFTALPNTDSQITPAAVARDISSRIETLRGELPDVEEPAGRAWKPWGYGYGNYHRETGLRNPHNAVLSLWWQLGLLSLPVFAGAGWLAWKHLSWRYALPLVPALMTDDFLVSYPAGVMAMAMYFALLRARSLPQDELVRPL